jgi:hypothetical protein
VRALLRVVACAAVAVAPSACVLHTHGANAPGHVDLSQRPMAKTPAEDPGERGLHVHVAPLLGAVGSETKSASGISMGFEAGIEPFSLPESHKDALFEGLAHVRFRPVVGWMAYRETRSGETFGPLYAELQWLQPIGPLLFGYVQVGAGATVNPVVGGGGPETTLCAGFHPLLGAVCGRAAYFADGQGGELTLLVSFPPFYFEHLWRK